ncbi:MAG: HAD-IIIC family phosphatase [bacterium]|jgi:FkbH-like protein
MKLREALEIIRAARTDPAENGRYLLACSSTPIHTQTFFRAHLLARRSGAGVQVDTSRYGDLLGSLEDFNPAGYAGAAVLLEWYDLDPRLGFRRLGGWAPGAFDDIFAAVGASLDRLRRSLARISESVPVALMLPTLPLPPLEISTPAQALNVETRLQRAVWAFAEDAASLRGVKLASAAELDRLSPPADRFDLRAELAQGCPYRLPHASAVAELLVELLIPAPALKGLITDLDDTLWSGILGEVGVSGIQFTLEGGAQIHGLYQQFLNSLAERGVLLAIASKNDPARVDEALSRSDLLVKRDSFFPVEVHWGPKSESVARILEAWNIGPDAVAFVDDSPLEAAEVQSRFPEVRCLRFPAGEPEQMPAFFHTLREWFGRPAIQAEDRIRARSIRDGAEARSAENAAGDREAFLASLDARLAFRLSRDASDERALELVNKTNQFNLNGRRIPEAQWREMLARPEAFLLTVEYSDKFGPLGKIAVAAGERRGSAAVVSCWVMSCRAFSRRIEHATLRRLFEELKVNDILFEYQATERNGPLGEFFAGLGIGGTDPKLSRADFDARCPTLSHAIQEAAHV